jgi:hypothetical protein
MKVEQQTVVPTVARIIQSGTPDAPRIESILANGSGFPLNNVQAVVLVYGADKNVIAASKTVVQNIPAQGESAAIFTWNNAFSTPASSIEVLPVILLP